MRWNAVATWLMLLFVAVPLARPTAPATARQSTPPTGQLPSTPNDPDLWSPANPTVGGMVFLVSPADASIYVDGSYAGRPLNFSPRRPLKLEAGQHRVEFVATGYATSRLDVGVVAGFVSTVDVVMERW